MRTYTHIELSSTSYTCMPLRFRCDDQHVFKGPRRQANCIGRNILPACVHSPTTRKRMSRVPVPFLALSSCCCCHAHVACRVEAVGGDTSAFPQAAARPPHSQVSLRSGLAIDTQVTSHADLAESCNFTSSIPASRRQVLPSRHCLHCAARLPCNINLLTQPLHLGAPEARDAPSPDTTHSTQQPT